MKLHEIPKGSTFSRKRLARGPASGTGKTAGRGHKGGKSRSGYSVRPGFEGGQMPLYRKLPQRGFSNFRFRTDYEVVNVGELAKLGTPTEVIDRKALAAAGLVRENKLPLKVLGEGEISVAIKILADKVSSSARAKIEAAGGEIIVPEVKTETAE